MKAIILSAGRGSRLFPLTVDTPKCLVPVQGDHPILGVQLQALAECGIDEAVIVVGFGAEYVEKYLLDNPVPGIRVRTVFNPFYDCSDNLMSCWVVRAEMDGDFLLMNGDTMWEPAVLETLLASPPAPVTVTINEKDEYDDDDMKVSLQADGRLEAVSKGLDGVIDGEAIGLIAFRGEGPKIFVDTLERTARDPGALTDYYLRIIESLARFVTIRTASITGLWWGEVDDHADLDEVRAVLNPVTRPLAAIVNGPLQRAPLRLAR